MGKARKGLKKGGLNWTLTANWIFYFTLCLILLTEKCHYGCVVNAKGGGGATASSFANSNHLFDGINSEWWWMRSFVVWKLTRNCRKFRVHQRRRWKWTNIFYVFFTKHPQGPFAVLQWRIKGESLNSSSCHIKCTFLSYNKMAMTSSEGSAISRMFITFI